MPFVAKAVGHPLAAYASLLMAGKSLADIGFTEEPVLTHVAVKEAVLPFDKFAGADTLLGPEMKSTGEVMGIDADFGKAYAKAAIAAGSRLPATGTVFITMTDKYKPAIAPIAAELVSMGYGVVATAGTAAALRSAGVPCSDVLKIQEGRPNAADLMRNGDVALMLITSTGDEPDVRDGRDLRRLALSLKIPIVTTLAGARDGRRARGHARRAAHPGSHSRLLSRDQGDGHAAPVNRDGEGWWGGRRGREVGACGGGAGSRRRGRARVAIKHWPSIHHPGER